MNTPDPDQIKHAIEQTFDLVASGYDAPAMRYFPFTADHLAASMQAKRGAKVLDVACGTGMTAMAMAQTIGSEGRVQAIDIADKMLDKARININKAGLSNIDLHRMDAEQLDFKSQYFDHACCTFGLFFLPDMPKAVKEILRVLKPGGQFIYTSFSRQAFSPLVTLFREHLAEFDIEIRACQMTAVAWISSATQALRKPKSITANSVIILPATMTGGKSSTTAVFVACWNNSNQCNSPASGPDIWPRLTNSPRIKAFG